MTVKPTVDLSGSANVSVKIPVKVVVGLNTKYYGQTIYLENENFKQPNEQENSDENDTDGEDNIDPNDPKNKKGEEVDTQDPKVDKSKDTDDPESSGNSDEADKLKKENDKMDLTEDDVTDGDRKKHKKIGDSIERSLKQDSSAATFDEFYAEKVAQAKALENQYQPQLSKGINLDLDLESKAKAEDDDKLKIDIEIAPNNFLDQVFIFLGDVLSGRWKARRELIAIIGESNKNLVDPLLDLVGIQNKEKLFYLAKEVTPSNANELTDLINTVGVNKIDDLVSSKIIDAMGTTHVSELADMITYIGGVGQLSELRDVISYKNKGNGIVAKDLTLISAGNPNLFKRLAKETPSFKKETPPSQPTAVIRHAISYYNDKINNYITGTMPTDLQNKIDNIKNAGQIIHQQATYFGGTNPGFMGAVSAKITDMVNLKTEISTNLSNGDSFDSQRTLAEGRIGVAFGLFRSLSNQIQGKVTAGIGPSNTSFNLATLVSNTTSAQTAKDDVSKLIPPEAVDSIDGINFPHFLDRHTPRFFDFNQIKTNNTQWDSNWGKNSVTILSIQVAEVIKKLADTSNWLKANNTIPGQNVPAGGTAQIGAMPGTTTGKISIRQFYPENNPSVRSFPYSDAEMVAIEKLV